MLDWSSNTGRFALHKIPPTDQQWVFDLKQPAQWAYGSRMLFNGKKILKILKNALAGQVMV
jgi:hypothetical protein